MLLVTDSGGDGGSVGVDAAELLQPTKRLITSTTSRSIIFFFVGYPSICIFILCSVLVGINIVAHTVRRYIARDNNFLCLAGFLPDLDQAKLQQFYTTLKKNGRLRETERYGPGLKCFLVPSAWRG